MGWVTQIGFARATPSDEEYAFQLRKAALAPYVTWNEDAERAQHARRFRDYTYWIVTADPEPVGVLVYAHTPAGIEIYQLYIEPQKQGRGMGGACMERVFEEAERLGVPIHLRVMKANPRALRFYLRMGFAVTGETETHLHLNLDPVPSGDSPNQSPSTV